MDIGLGTILYSLYQVCGVLIIALFQQPYLISRVKSGEYLAKASMQCITGLRGGIIDSIHIVYNVHDSPTKTSWKGNALVNLALLMCTADQLRDIVVCQSSHMLPSKSH